MRLQFSVVILLLFAGLSQLTHAAPVRVMPIGDSITAGWGPQPLPDYGTAGYRLPLQAHLAAAGIKYDFVGNQSLGFDLNQHDGFMFDPNWYGSDHIYADQIASTIANDLLVYRPDVVLVNIGTYDVLHQKVPNGSNITLQPPWLAARDVVEVVDIIHRTDPTIKIIFMVPGTGITRHLPLEELRTELLSLMSTRSFADVLDLRGVLRTSTNRQAPQDYGSLFHPNQMGYERIAEALAPLLLDATLKQPPPATPVPLPAGLPLILGALLLLLRNKFS